MAFSSVIKQFASVHTKFDKTIKEALTKHNEVEISLNKNDPMLLSFDAKEQRNIFEKTIIDYERAIDGYVKETADYLIKLKIHLNSLVFINRLPIELLSRIVFFTFPTTGHVVNGWRYYINYTWVCHHWRSVLIQTADLWTSLHLTPGKRFEVVHELLRRSKSAKLDIKISTPISSGILSISILKDLAKESHRFHRLWVEGKKTDKIESTFKGKLFPSLRRVIYNDWGRNSGLGLIPMIITSDGLETLDFQFWRNITVDAIHQLAPILSRTPNLRLHFCTLEILQYVFERQLHNNTNLRNLQLRVKWKISSPLSNSLGQIILPELQFLSCTEPSLLQVLRAPKLSSLDSLHDSPVLNNPIHDGFDFASTRYLHLLDRPDRLFSILGLKEPIHPKAVFSVNTEDFREELLFIEKVDGIVDGNGILSDTWPPGCFRFEFYDIRVFAQSVKGALFSLLPRLTGLLEICLASHVILKDKEFHLDKFLAQVPSLRKLIVPYGNGLIDFIRHLTTDTSLCPQLDYLSYTTSHPNFGREELESLGELLTECVQRRRKIYDGALRYIVLGECPSLPDVWFMELQKLGTTVVTESVVVRVYESDSPESPGPEPSGPSEED